MKITVTEKKEIEINEDLVKGMVSNYAKELLEREKRVLSEEYINWLSEFVKREETFDDEPNRVEYCGKYTQDEKEKIHLVSTLFYVVSQYYDKHGIEYSVLKSHFYNKGLTVNLTEEVSVEIRLWCGQGAVTDVSLIQSKTGKVDVKAVVQKYSK